MRQILKWARACRFGSSQWWAELTAAAEEARDRELAAK